MPHPGPGLTCLTRALRMSSSPLTLRSASRSIPAARARAAFAVRVHDFAIASPACSQARAAAARVVAAVTGSTVAPPVQLGGLLVNREGGSRWADWPRPRQVTCDV